MQVVYIIWLKGNWRKMEFWRNTASTCLAKRVLTQYIVYGTIITTIYRNPRVPVRRVRLKRETGESPVRSRRCNGEMFHIEGH